MSIIQVEVKDIEKLVQAMDRFPGRIKEYLGSAALDAGRKLLMTEGLQQYPPATSANQPPAPYYIRGVGMQYKTRNDLRSENLGAQWTAKMTDPLSLQLGNRASYARWVHGEEQARWMGPKGWKKLFATAKEKIDMIRRVYQGWVDKCLVELGL